MVVYTSDEDNYREVAEKIATERDESLVTEFEAVRRTNQPVVWVESPSNLTEVKLLSLQRRLFTAGPDAGAFSVITGYTPELADDLYFCQRKTSGKDALVFRNAPKEVPASGNTTALRDDEVTADAIEQITTERLRSFEIRAGGHPIHITLWDGFICGFPESQQIDDYFGIQPFCVRNGERDCPLEENLVTAESIDAAHVFLMSCASMINNGTADLPVHVGMGLLNGAESLIGSYRITASRPHELLLHHSLLEAGYDVNERCYILNKNSHRNAIEPFPYIAFGKPTAAVSDPYESQFTVDAQFDGAVQIVITDIDAYVVDFRIPADELPASPEDLYVRNESDVPVHYTIFEEGGDARVLLYSGGHLQSDQLALTISDSPSHSLERRIAIASAKNLTRTQEAGFLTTKGTEQASQLRNQLRTLPERSVNEMFHANAHMDVEQQLNSLHGHVNAIREELLNSIRMAPYLPRHYAKNVIDETVYVSDESCTSCGDRPLFVKQVNGWEVGTKRLFSQCPRCGLVFDVPAVDQDAAPTYPKVRVDQTVGDDRKRPLKIEFQNRTDAPMQATFQPLVLHVDNEETDFFKPERRDAILASGDSHTAVFTLDTSHLTHEVYYILGLVVANLDVYGGYHTTVLGDSAGYYPRKLR